MAGWRFWQTNLFSVRIHWINLCTLHWRTSIDRCIINNTTIWLKPIKGTWIYFIIVAFSTNIVCSYYTRWQSGLISIDARRVLHNNLGREFKCVMKYGSNWKIRRQIISKNKMLENGQITDFAAKFDKL